MKAAELVKKMIDDLDEVLQDAVKADKGQKAPGTRVRKAMQGVKAQAQEIRKVILENQKAD
jgi:hypothetical protein